jgi:hypothetical protein
LYYAGSLILEGVIAENGKIFKTNESGHNH